MIIDQKSKNSNLELDGKTFGVDNFGKLFDILRSKMYSNPIASICREISCNARDAHREVGKFDIPIEISLPVHHDPFYKIKDFGPGISPDRMENVFINYTASTKTNDNTQTGGFGCGSKTPFAYTDDFNVNTVFNRIKYNYICVIDSSGLGKLILLSSNSTTEEPGTEIVIPVKEADFNKFLDGTELATRHFEVKPIIKNEFLNYERFDEKLYDGEKWTILKKLSYHPYHSYDENKIRLIIDGIEYPLVKNKIKDFDYSLLNGLKAELFLYFQIGELTLSATREQVHFDNKTTELINQRIDEVKAQLLAQIENEISKEPSFLDAVNKATKIKMDFVHFGELKNIKWNNCSVFFNFDRSNRIEIKNDVSCYTKEADGSFYKEKYASGIKLEKSLIVYNDYTDRKFTTYHAKKLFEKFPHYTTLQVIDNVGWSLEEINKNYHLDQLGIFNLSDHLKLREKKEIVEETKLSKLIFYKFDGKQFNRVKLSDVENDEQEKILFNLNEDKQVIYKELFLDSSDLNGIKENVSFYGTKILDKEIDIDFTSFEEYLKKILPYGHEKFVELKSLISQNTYSYRLGEIDEEDLKILDQNSLFLKRIKNNDGFYISPEDRRFLQIYEKFIQPISKEEIANWLALNEDKNMEKLNAECENKYPLVFKFNYLSADLIPLLVDYVKMIDERK
jgi:hypothetical protein